MTFFDSLSNTRDACILPYNKSFQTVINRLRKKYNIFPDKIQ